MNATPLALVGANAAAVRLVTRDGEVLEVERMLHWCGVRAGFGARASATHCAGVTRPTLQSQRSFRLALILEPQPLLTLAPAPAPALATVVAR